MKNQKSLKISGLTHNCQQKKRKIFYDESYVKKKPYCKHCGETLSKDKILRFEVSDCL